MILVILLIFLFLIASLGKASEERETPDANPRACVQGKAVLTQRRENARLINECIHQMNASSTRASISSWRYQAGSTEEIFIKFSEEEMGYPARVSFIKSKGSPHVSRITYTDTLGESKVLRGYIPRGFTYEMLLEKYKKDRLDQDKIRYINDIARIACDEGEAIFNILTYLDISEKEFKESFKARERKAMLAMLGEEFKTVEICSSPWLLRVTPLDEPALN